MATVVANELKTKGIKAIEDALLTQPEASLSVRGQIKYVVMSQAHYHYLRECELEAALAARDTLIDTLRFQLAHLRRPRRLRLRRRHGGDVGHVGDLVDDLHRF